MVQTQAIIKYISSGLLRKVLMQFMDVKLQNMGITHHPVNFQN